MKFVLQQAIKWKVIADFLANHSVPKNYELYEIIPDEIVEANTTSRDGVWQMFFDGIARMGPKGKSLPE